MSKKIDSKDLACPNCGAVRYNLGSVVEKKIARRFTCSVDNAIMSL